MTTHKLAPAAINFENSFNFLVSLYTGRSYLPKSRYGWIAKKYSRRDIRFVFAWYTSYIKVLLRWKQLFVDHCDE